jgi:NAD+ kinase
MQHMGSPSSSTNGTENGTIAESDRTMNNGESCEIDIETARHNLEVTNALSNDQSTQQGEMPGTGAELLSDFKLESNPLKAQFPICDVFSRKEMTKFFRSKKVYPKSVLNSRRRSSSLLVSRRKQNLSAERNGTMDYEAAEFAVLESSNGKSFDNDYILSVASGITNGKPSNNGASSLIEEKETEVSVATVDTRASASSSNGKVQVGSQKFAEKNGAPYVERNKSDNVDGNMCASSTGVVRLQSRRKAEMFLVRTDGFSCTREKVTESSLAFTHPSTQQQMLMWKSPPKTVLLLKKLGDELMEEAKEVNVTFPFRAYILFFLDPSDTYTGCINFLYLVSMDYSSQGSLGFLTYIMNLLLEKFVHENGFMFWRYFVVFCYRVHNYFVVRCKKID